MHTLIIHNANAGFGSDAIFLFMRYLVRSGDDCEFRSLAADWDAEDAVADADDFDLVVVSGGDGTVATLLHALRDTTALVCVFPSGTANLFFVNLGNCSEPAALARACRIGHAITPDLGHVRWVDGAGEAHERGFALMAGSGFDAELMRAAVPNKKAMGEAAYFLAALANPRPPVVTFTIDCDGERHVRDGIACIVANTAKIQGDIEIIPDCRLDDGLLDVIVLESPDVAGLIKPLFAALVDRRGSSIGRPQIESFKGRSIRVRSSSPIPMQIDGEPVEGDVMGFDAQVTRESCRLVVDNMSPYDPGDDAAPLFPGTEERAFPN